jgi:hypothetical protein
MPPPQTRRHRHQKPKKCSGTETLTLQHKSGLIIEHHKKNEKILSKLSGNKMQGRYILIKTKFGGGDVVNVPYILRG